MTAKPKYYFNLDGNITDGEKEYSLYNIEDVVGGLSISSDLKERYVLYGRNSLLDLLNELYEEKEQLLSDKEHLMGCLIRFFGYDDEDIDYNLNRESNQEYGKQYYEMKEKDW